jgi:hypothetical protein
MQYDLIPALYKKLLTKCKGKIRVTPRCRTERPAGLVLLAPLFTAPSKTFAAHTQESLFAYALVRRYRNPWCLAPLHPLLWQSQGK